MIRTIVVPLDGSKFAEQALPLALCTARRAGARVELVHVHDTCQDYSELLLLDAPLDFAVRADERCYLEKIAKKLSPDDDVPISISVVTKNTLVPDAINEHARSVAADLVVMTTHARGPFARFWLGSVADSLIRTAESPLLLIHPQEGCDPPSGKDVPPRNILVALDGSALAEEILGPAATLAKVTGASLTLMRVVEALSPMIIPAGSGSLGAVALQGAEEVDVMQQKIRVEAVEYLEKIAHRLREQGLGATIRLATDDQPARAILETSDVDLIALETHGRRGLARLILGSVADKVIRGSTVPLLVCRPKTQDRSKAVGKEKT